jgi:hypothetical protein
LYKLCSKFLQKTRIRQLQEDYIASNFDFPGTDELLTGADVIARKALPFMARQEPNKYRPQEDAQ